ncbi:MAG: adenylate/guanylate cyclase domain-containing protein [Anaerolineae bacterium]
MSAKRILVIEDARTLAAFLHRKLLVNGGAFIVERAGSSGNGHGRTFGGDYDLILANLEGETVEVSNPLFPNGRFPEDAHPLLVSPPGAADGPGFLPEPLEDASGANQELVFDGVRVLSVLVADIERSTPLTRSLGPQGMLEFLKEFYLEMIRAVGRSGCTKQYSGDQVLVLFEEPLAAVQRALQMQEAFADLCARWRRRSPVRPGLGIGIATGMVAGDAHQFRHVLAGAPVIVAARLSALSKEESAILVDEATYQAVKGLVPTVRQAKPRSIKGFDAPLQLYRVVTLEPASVDEFRPVPAPVGA